MRVGIFEAMKRHCECIDGDCSKCHVETLCGILMDRIPSEYDKDTLHIVKEEIKQL